MDERKSTLLKGTVLVLLVVGMTGIVFSNYSLIDSFYLCIVVFYLCKFIHIKKKV